MAQGGISPGRHTSPAFSECTACHVTRPGSKKLTDRGRVFAFAVRDMEGLKLWLRESHPQLRGEPGQQHR